MKKILLWLLMVVGLISVIVFGTIGYAYYKTDETAIPTASITYGGNELTLNGYEWNASVLKGLLYKSSSKGRSLASDNLGAFESANPVLTVSDNFNSLIKISDGNTIVFEGTASEYQLFSFEKNGAYKLSAQLTTKHADGESNGRFNFDAGFEIAVAPKIVLSSDRIEQGGVISVIVTDIMNGTTPEIKTELGLSVFTRLNSNSVAFVPVAYNREPGKYTIDVRCGDIFVSKEVEVLHKNFLRQDMTVDQDVADSTANSAAANAEFREKIIPLYELADTTTYWEGLFDQPCYGRITSEFGLRRYTNGAKTPVRHGGIDIAAPQGTAVLSPNGGKVLFAEFIALTGNTVVIEHGAGLKSYFYHMDSIATEEGAIIAKGDKVGEVGTTGYSTGPHLHYEVKIGNQSVNPWDLFDGRSGIFFTP